MAGGLAPYDDPEDTRTDLEATMPPKSRGAGDAARAKKATPVKGVNPEDARLTQREHDPAQSSSVAARIPIPTAVVAEWFPAYFRPVDDPQPWATCKVFLTPQGLYVYRAAPESETVQAGAQPAWYAGVNFAETAKPVTGYAAQNAGIPITTSAGKVNVQPYGGCGCSARKLKNWTPSWARNRISWADAVKLIDATAGR